MASACVCIYTHVSVYVYGRVMKLEKDHKRRGRTLEGDGKFRGQCGTCHKKGEGGPTWGRKGTSWRAEEDAHGGQWGRGTENSLMTQMWRRLPRTLNKRNRVGQAYPSPWEAGHGFL